MQRVLLKSEFAGTTGDVMRHRLSFVITLKFTIISRRKNL